MSTQTLYQGNLWSTNVPAIKGVHPGLQVQSIAAPKTERRLSVLMSATLFCAFAAGAVWVAQVSPSFNKPIIKTEPDHVLAELRPPEAIAKAVAPAVTPIAPILSKNLPSNLAVTQTIPEPTPIVNTDITPTTLQTIDLSYLIGPTSISAIGTSHELGDGATNGTQVGGDPSGIPTSQPIEVSSNAVSVLHQIQPIYPSLARVAHKEGDVVLIMTINEKGVPTDVKMDSGDAIFKSDAIQAAQQWRFTSARFDGQPHSARFRLTLQFRLRG